MLSVILQSSIEETTNQYSLFEIIFWYSAFVITIIITIILLTNRKTNKKRMEALISNLNNDIKTYDDFIKKPASRKHELREMCSKTILLLTSFETKFLDFKEKTRSSDFDILIDKKQKIVDSIRKLDTKKSKNSAQDAENIKNELLELKEAMENVKSYLR